MSKPLSPEPPPPATCTTLVEGGETSCKPVSTWKDYAYETCRTQGLTLTNYWPGTACGADSFRYVKYECCPSTPVVSPCATVKCSAGYECVVNKANPPAAQCVPVEGGPTPQPQPACFSARDGGESSCKPAATWKEYAYGYCKAKGLTLTNLSLDLACGGDSFRYIKYECCSAK